MPLKRTFDSLTPAIEKWRQFPAKWQSKAVKLLLAVGTLVAAESKRRAPILKGNIEMSHRVLLTRRQTNAISVSVEVGDDSTAKYLDFIHEGSYNLGPLSQKKQAADPSVKVGSKFLERGLDAVEDDIVEKIADELFGEIS